MLKKFIAFTLAEVIRVIGIIGVVAAFVIPNLNNSTSEEELKSLFKKNYSLLQDAWNQMVVDGGGEISPDLYGASKGGLVAKLIRDALCEKIKCTVTCGNLQDCYYKSTDEYQNYNGTNQGWSSLIGTYNAQFVNGAMISVDIQTPGFTGADSTGPVFHGSGGWLGLDTNGFKPPNRIGKDIFRIYIYKDGILADGVPGPAYCSASSTLSYNGIGCGWYILQNKSMP